MQDADAKAHYIHSQNMLLKLLHSAQNCSDSTSQMKHSMCQKEAHHAYRYRDIRDIGK